MFGLEKEVIRVILQREIKEDMVAKRQVLLLLYHLVKGFAIVSNRRKLVVKYMLIL